MVDSMLDGRRVLIFCAFACGLAWAVGGIIYLTGGLVDSPQLVPGTGLTLAAVLLATGYMWAPALANVCTRLITREGWRDLGLWPRLREGWPYWLAAWFAPLLMTVLGAVLYFLFFPRSFDPSLAQLQQALDESGAGAAVSPWVLVGVQTALAVTVAPLFNGLFAFGEEFGWRGYLLPRLMPLGARRALLLSGAVWGAWHAPLIAMGYNYGFGYFGAPWLGMLTMVWFTMVSGTVLGWLALRAGSVWPAVFGHGAINAISALGLLFLRAEPRPLLGPAPVAWIGSAAWTAAALWILLRPGALQRKGSASGGDLAPREEEAQ